MSTPWSSHHCTCSALTLGPAAIAGCAVFFLIIPIQVSLLSLWSCTSLSLSCSSFSEAYTLYIYTHTLATWGADCVWAADGQAAAPGDWTHGCARAAHERDPHRDQGATPSSSSACMHACVLLFLALIASFCGADDQDVCVGGRVC